MLTCSHPNNAEDKLGQLVHDSNTRLCLYFDQMIQSEILIQHHTVSSLFPYAKLRHTCSGYLQVVSSNGQATQLHQRLDMGREP
mgnify:CR=1 FL=1